MNKLKRMRQPTEDTEEQRKMCLHCKRSECNNCIEWRKPPRINKWCKAVKAISADGVETIYPSAQAAAYEIGCHAQSITNALKGKVKSSMGYTWEYVE